MRRALPVFLALAMTTGYAFASGGPDSKTQPLQDGCNRSDLVILAEAFAGLENLGDVEIAPEWVYVNGDRTPRTIEGTIRAVHTAGADLFGSHDTYDANFDVLVDPEYADLVSTADVEEYGAPAIHTEWEPKFVPTWAWPSPGDHVRETGSYIWDCGHWQGGSRAYSNSDHIPGDPLGTAGIEPIRGEETEIHPIHELATWHSPSAYNGVAASELDVFISNQGGKAQAVENCALLSPGHPTAGTSRVVNDLSCPQTQDITGRDYRYVLNAPPKPSPDAVLRIAAIDRGSHNAPASRVEMLADAAVVTVPFSGVARADGVQDFGATYYLYWDADPAPVHRFLVALNALQVRNNMDSDIGEDSSDPTITPDGEWNVYLDIAGTWRNLHDPLRVDEVPELGAVPAAPALFDLSSLQPTIVELPADGVFRMYVDARECDLPGFQDCPTEGELDFPQTVGRAELVIPMSQLAGATTTVSDLHPIVCVGTDNCPEENSPGLRCPDGCYGLSFTITDVTGGPPGKAMRITGDGSAAGTIVNGVPASALRWWRERISRPSEDQDDERPVIKRAIENAKASLRDR
jgi:hypothetical protein